VPQYHQFSYDSSIRYVDLSKKGFNYQLFLSQKQKSLEISEAILFSFLSVDRSLRCAWLPTTD